MATSSSGRFSVALEVGPQNGKGKGAGPRSGASQDKTLHVTQGELMSRLVHSV